MPTNQSKTSLRKRKQTLEQFDRLPLSVKEVLWYAPIKFVARGLSAQQVAMAIGSKRAILAFEAWGPDHPEAQAYVKLQPNPQDLGL